MRKLLTAALLSAFCSVTAAHAATPTLKAFALRTGVVDETSMATATSVAVVMPSEKEATTAPNFGMRLSVPGNANFMIDFIRYSVRRTAASEPETVVLDGANTPITERPFGSYNNSAVPRIRSEDEAGNQTWTANVQVSGSTLANTHAVYVENQRLDLGSVRRPLLASFGGRYSIEYHVVGSVNGEPFDLKSKSTVVVAHGVARPHIDNSGNSLDRFGIIGTEVLGTQRFLTLRDVAGTRLVAFGVEEKPVLVEGAFTAYAQDLAVTSEVGRVMVELPPALGPELNQQRFFWARWFFLE